MPEDMSPELADGWARFYRGVQTTYGITPQQYRDLYVAQHGCCYICRVAKGVSPDDPRVRPGVRRLGVDHNHVTGKVRGLLCTGSTSANTCNRLIARYNIHQLRRAVKYLEEEPGRSVLMLGAELDRIDMNESRDALMRDVLGLM